MFVDDSRQEPRVVSLDGVLFEVDAETYNYYRTAYGCELEALAVSNAEVVGRFAYFGQPVRHRGAVPRRPGHGRVASAGNHRTWSARPVATAKQGTAKEPAVKLLAMRPITAAELLVGLKCLR